MHLHDTNTQTVALISQSCRQFSSPPYHCNLAISGALSGPDSTTGQNGSDDISSRQISVISLIQPGEEVLVLVPSPTPSLSLRVNWKVSSRYAAGPPHACAENDRADIIVIAGFVGGGEMADVRDTSGDTLSPGRCISFTWDSPRCFKSCCAPGSPYLHHSL
jgi:hypothetical protein